MKTTHINLKKGEIKLKAENLDDLWTLSSLIDSNDLILGKTLRKIKLGEENQRKSNVVKKPVFISLKVEKVDFSENSNILRISGTITAGPDDVPLGSHHTFNVEENTLFTIKKEKWLKFQLDKIKEACSSKVAKILICVFDREDSYFALMKKYGYDVLTTLKGDVQKKESDEKVKGNFYLEIIKKIQDYEKKYSFSSIILASPSFFKEDLMKELKIDELKKKIILATCSSVGKNGIDEVLKRNEVRQALLQDRIAKEMNLVEELLTEISKSNLAAYGKAEVVNATDAGAVKTLLITDSFIQKTRSENTFIEIDKIMKNVDTAKGEIHIVSSKHDGGRKLDGLGGIAALLRYKLNY